jgi:hypothetical protein
MADNSDDLILEALKRAAVNPGGLPLLGTRRAKGLFDTTKSDKIAAQRASELGLIRPLSTESNGKPGAELFGMTEAGLNHLLNHTDPSRILVALIATLEKYESQVAELAGGTRKLEASFRPLSELVKAVLTRMDGGRVDKNCREGLLEHLSRWQLDRPTEDCPLPELYRMTCETCPAISLGQFHDALRMTNEAGWVYLHPWTGPLYELPEPAHALLSGHEVVYYASLRRQAVGSSKAQRQTTVTHAGV